MSTSTVQIALKFCPQKYVCSIKIILPGWFVGRASSRYATRTTACAETKLLLKMLEMNGIENKLIKWWIRWMYYPARLAASYFPKNVWRIASSARLIVSMTTHGAFDNEDTRKEKCRNALDGLFELNVHDMMPRVNDIIFQEMIDH